MAKTVEQFNTRLTETLNPGHSAKELVEHIVKAALEIEFGPGFTLSPGFDKMKSAIAQTIVCNPDLRQQALAIASLYLEKKIEEKTKKKRS